MIIVVAMTVCAKLNVNAANLMIASTRPAPASVITTPVHATVAANRVKKPGMPAEMCENGTGKPLHFSLSRLTPT